MASAVNTRHALIVEDERLLLDSLEESLRRVDWLRITKARTAELALEQFDVDPPDVVITDVGMPGMGGLELLDQLRARKSDVPVVVMTAYGAHLQREALRRGATCFLEKPFRMSELRGVLQLLLAKSGSFPPEPAGQVSFEGRLESLSLADIVQVTCLSRENARVEVAVGDKRGALWLRDGSVIDAMYDGLSGAEAFYALTTNAQGRFRVLEDATLRPRTVNENWQELLTAAARGRDERARIGVGGNSASNRRPSFRPSLLVPMRSFRPDATRQVKDLSRVNLAPAQSLADVLGAFSNADEAPDEAVRAGAEAMDRGEL
jgi:DNA-binding response OmpR family regulator